MRVKSYPSKKVELLCPDIIAPLIHMEHVPTPCVFAQTEKINQMPKLVIISITQEIVKAYFRSEVFRYILSNHFVKF